MSKNLNFVAGGHFCFDPRIPKTCFSATGSLEQLGGLGTLGLLLFGVFGLFPQILGVMKLISVLISGPLQQR